MKKLFFGILFWIALTLPLLALEVGTERVSPDLEWLAKTETVGVSKPQYWVERKIKWWDLKTGLSLQSPAGFECLANPTFTTGMSSVPEPYRKIHGQQVGNLLYSWCEGYPYFQVWDLEQRKWLKNIPLPFDYTYSEPHYLYFQLNWDSTEKWAGLHLEETQLVHNNPKGQRVINIPSGSQGIQANDTFLLLNYWQGRGPELKSLIRTYHLPELSPMGEWQVPSETDLIALKQNVLGIQLLSDRHEPLKKLELSLLDYRSGKPLQKKSFSKILELGLTSDGIWLAQSDQVLILNEDLQLRKRLKFSVRAEIIRLIENLIFVQSKQYLYVYELSSGKFLGQRPMTEKLNTVYAYPSFYRLDTETDSLYLHAQSLKILSKTEIQQMDNSETCSSDSTLFNEDDYFKMQWQQELCFSEQESLTIEKKETVGIYELQTGRQVKHFTLDTNPLWFHLLENKLYRFDFNEGFPLLLSESLNSTETVQTLEGPETSPFISLGEGKHLWVADPFQIRYYDLKEFRLKSTFPMPECLPHKLFRNGQELIYLCHKNYPAWRLAGGEYKQNNWNNESEEISMRFGIAFTLKDDQIEFTRQLTPQEWEDLVERVSMDYPLYDQERSWEIERFFPKLELSQPQSQESKNLRDLDYQTGQLSSLRQVAFQWKKPLWKTEQKDNQTVLRNTQTGVEKPLPLPQTGSPYSVLDYDKENLLLRNDRYRHLLWSLNEKKIMWQEKESTRYAHVNYEKGILLKVSTFNLLQGEYLVELENSKKKQSMKFTFKSHDRFGAMLEQDWLIFRSDAFHSEKTEMIHFDIENQQILGHVQVIQKGQNLLFITQEGYYAGFGDWQNLAHFQDTEKSLPLSAFPQYHRPDLVWKVLQGENLKGYPSLHLQGALK